MLFSKISTLYRVELPHDDLRLLFLAARFHGSKLHEKMKAITGVYGVEIHPEGTTFALQVHINEQQCLPGVFHAIDNLLTAELASAEKAKSSWQNHF